MLALIAFSSGRRWRRSRRMRCLRQLQAVVIQAQLVQYICGYRTEVFADTIIGITKHSNPPQGKLLISLCISLYMCIGQMLFSVYFNRYFFLCNIKVQNIVFNIVLTPHIAGKFFQKVIPKMLFFRCHIFTKRSRVLDKLFIIWQHGYSSSTADAVPLLPQEKAFLVVRQSLFAPYIILPRMNVAAAATTM